MYKQREEVKPEPVKKFVSTHKLKFETEELRENGRVGKHIEAKCEECGYTYYIVACDEDGCDETKFEEEFQDHLQGDKGYKMTCGEYLMWAYMGKPRN
jgi:hypothetical protein